MQVRLRSTGQSVSLGPHLQLGKGGEGVIYALPNQPDLVAKLYHRSQVTPERGRKLELMLNNPPDDPMRSRGHVSIAWPIDILEYPVTGEIVGFTMSRVVGMKPVFEYYDPKSRIRNSPAFSYDYLCRTALNLVSALRSLHAKQYVIGDVNESNVMVSNNALVTLVDTDSFQVADPQNLITYRCPVGKEEFTPAELQGKPFSQIDRRQEHDLFGLGVLLFHLLMENTQPFGGVFAGRGDPPEYGDRIGSGYFLYCQSKSVPFRPGPLAPSFNILHPELQRLFRLCFEDGHLTPKSRPSAESWCQALRTAEKALTSCSVNGQHWFGSHLQSCPWCDRAKKLGIDPFPSKIHAQSAAAVFNTRKQGVGIQSPMSPRPIPVRPPTSPPPTVNSFYANSASLQLGQSCTLIWDVTNAQRVSINHGLGVVAPTGNLIVSPTRNTSYVLTALGTGGIVRQTVYVRVTKPSPILSFTASSQSLTVGQPVTLRWNVAQTHAVHINNRIGVVPNTGQVTMTPFKSTTYVLTATGNGWPIRRSIKLKVMLPPLPVSLNSYSSLQATSISLPQFAALHSYPLFLQHCIALLSVTALRMFGPLQTTTLALNNPIVLQNPQVAPIPKPKPSSKRLRPRFAGGHSNWFGFRKIKIGRSPKVTPRLGAVEDLG